MIKLIEAAISQASLMASELSRFVFDHIVMFGLIVSIVALAFNHMLGSAGVPFLGNALPTLIGGFTVSAITTRLSFVIVEAAGIEMLPFLNDMGWVYNNKDNMALVNEFLSKNPPLCVALIVFSLSASLVLGGIGGWLISKPALRLGSVYLMMASFVLVNLASMFGRNIIALMGGTMGVFVPDILAFYNGDRTILFAILTLLVASGVFIVLRAVENSPYGRLLTAIRDNELTAQSIGKDVVRIKGGVILVGSGIMALAGALLAFYFSFVVEANFHNYLWMYWPLLMIILGGLGSLKGTFLGVALIVTLRATIVFFRYNISSFIFFPIVYLEDLLLAVMILVALIMFPKGIIPEKLRPIIKVRYTETMQEETS
jgi:branched-chain amino acid transport system permease protein